MKNLLAKGTLADWLDSLLEGRAIIALRLFVIAKCPVQASIAFRCGILCDAFCTLEQDLLRQLRG